MARFLSPSEALPSWEELDAQQRAASVQQQDAAQGKTWGSLLGAALGIGLGAATGSPAAAASGGQMGYELGGAAGQYVGGDLIGGPAAEAAQARLQMLEAARQQRIAKDEQRRRAIAALVQRSAF